MNTKIHKKRPNNWLDRPLYWKLIPIQNNVYGQTIENLQNIVEEYRILISISEPSKSQQRRIEQILLLAVHNTLLSKEIDYIEQDIAREIGLVEEQNLNNHYASQKTTILNWEENDYLQNNDKIVFSLSQGGGITIKKFTYTQDHT